MKSQFFLERLPQTNFCRLYSLLQERITDISFEDLTLVLGEEKIFDDFNLSFKGGKFLESKALLVVVKLRWLGFNWIS